MNQVDWQASGYYLLSQALYHATLASLFLDQQWPEQEDYERLVYLATETNRADVLARLSGLIQ